MIRVKQKWKEYRQDIKESLIVFGILTGLLLPLRITFVTYVSRDWFGSFGILTVASVVLVILVRKNKLGAFGPMFLRQMTKNQHGKRAYFFYIRSIFLIFVLAGTIYAINLGNTIYLEQKHELVLQHPELLDQKKMAEQTKDVSPDKIIIGILFIPVLVILKFHLFAVLLSIINDEFHGMVMTMYTVALVESLEVFGIMLFYRFTLTKNIK